MAVVNADAASEAGTPLSAAQKADYGAAVEVEEMDMRAYQDPG